MNVSLSRSYLSRIAGILVLTLAATTFSVLAQSAEPEIQRLFSEARTAEGEGRYDDAILIYRKVVALGNQNPKEAAVAYFDAGLLYLQFKKYEDAANAFRNSIKLDPTSAEANNNLGEALAHLNRTSEAIAAFQSAVALDRNLLIARFNMGLAYARMGQSQYAEFVYRALIREHPEYALGYDGMAVTLSQTGRARDAIGFHEKAIALDPSTAVFYYNLGISYLILGNKEKAGEQLPKLQQLDPRAADKLAAIIARQKK